MTRGARSKRAERQEEPVDGDPGTSADQQGAAAASSPDKLEELTSLVKSLVSSEAERDQNMKAEAMHQEQRWRTMPHRFLQIQAQVKLDKKDKKADDEEDTEVMACRTSQQNEPPPPQRAPRMHRDPKLIPLALDDDIEHFLTTFERTFERIATICRWPKEERVIQRVPLLTGKARSAYVLIDINDAEEYEKVKEVIVTADI